MLKSPMSAPSGVQVDGWMPTYSGEERPRWKVARLARLG